MSQCNYLSEGIQVFRTDWCLNTDQNERYNFNILYAAQKS